MTDQPQPAASGYPGFEITADGMSELYREFGRLFHQASETNLKTKRLVELATTLQQAHGPGQCQPITAPVAEVIDAVPTPLRSKGG